jgi:hypothetical protein
VAWSSFPSFFKPLIIRRNEAQRGCDPYDNFEFTCGKGSSNIHCVSESATRFEAGISWLRLFGFRIRCLSRPALQLTLNRCVDTEAAYPAAVMNSSNSLSPLNAEPFMTWALGCQSAALRCSSPARAASAACVHRNDSHIRRSFADGFVARTQPGARRLMTFLDRFAKHSNIRPLPIKPLRRALRAKF